MNQKEEKILRQYLKRMIAEKNSKFASLSYKYKDLARTWRSTIYINFARGNNSTFDRTPSNMNYWAIKDDINRRSGKVSAYHYFDLDTLMAYNVYLSKVLKDTEDFRIQHNRNHFFDEGYDKDFARAIDHTVPEFFLKNAGTKETGFYDASFPVKVLRENGKLKCESTPNARSFNEKYTQNYLDSLMQRYINEKMQIASEEHDIPEDNESIESIKRQIAHKREKVESAKNKDKDEEYQFIPDFEHNGVEYMANKKEYYLDENQFPVMYVDAVDRSQTRRLIGYLDASMKEYIGDIYDTEGNFLYDRSESGLDIYDKPLEKH